MQEVPPPYVKLKKLLDQKKLYDLVRFSTESSIFEALCSPASAEDVASVTGTDEHFASYLLDALAAAGFIDTVKYGDRLKYVNNGLSGRYLRQSGSLYVGDVVFSEPSSYKNLRDYVEKGPSKDAVDKAYWTPEVMKRIASYAFMGWVQDAVEAVDLSGRERLLDIGGGHGLYSIFFTKRYPGLKATVLDFPDVLRATAEYIDLFDAKNEVDTIGGDYRDGLPAGKYDVVFTSNVVAYHADLCLLLERAREALAPGGIIVVRNAVFGIADPASSIFSLEKYARTGRQWFTKRDIVDALAAAGFKDIVALYERDGHVILKGMM
jgi:predicted O-methyltransferase YrrM